VVAIVLLVVTLALSLSITRVGTVALKLTGMSEESAHFQARSAFYGVGFTTNESESVVNHPVRRRVILLLMLAGNLGIATSVATILATLSTTSSSDAWAKNLLILSVGLSFLVIMANSRWVNRTMSHLITRALRRWTTLDVHDYVALLHLRAGYSVLEVNVLPGDWLADKTLSELSLSTHGVLLLGIHRAGNVFIGAPTGRTRIHSYDTLVIYGPLRYLDAICHHRPLSPIDDSSSHLVEQRRITQKPAENAKAA
jgi:hypothetical protein